MKLRGARPRIARSPISGRGACDVPQAGRTDHPMRIFTASLGTETNTYAPIPTDRSAFESTFYAPPGEHP